MFDSRASSASTKARAAISARSRAAAGLLGCRCSEARLIARSPRDQAGRDAAGRARPRGRPRRRACSAPKVARPSRCSRSACASSPAARSSVDPRGQQLGGLVGAVERDQDAEVHRQSCASFDGSSTASAWGSASQRLVLGAELGELASRGRTRHPASAGARRRRERWRTHPSGSARRSARSARARVRASARACPSVPSRRSNSAPMRSAAAQAAAASSAAPQAPSWAPKNGASAGESAPRTGVSPWPAAVTRSSANANAAERGEVRVDVETVVARATRCAARPARARGPRCRSAPRTRCCSRRCAGCRGCPCARR